MANPDERRMRRIESLVAKMEAIPDPSVRADTKQLMEAILELHGAGLERILELVHDAEHVGEALVDRVAEDPLVCSLLVLHGLHPQDLAARARTALSAIRGVELVDVEDGIVRARVTGEGCGLKQAAFDSLSAALPDAAEILVEEGPARNGFVPLASIA